MHVTFSTIEEHSGKNFSVAIDSIRQTKGKNKDAKTQRKHIKEDMMEKTEEQAKSLEATRNGVNFSLSTRTYQGDQALRPDPYESRLIECRASEIPDSGEGLYAKCDLAKDTVVAFYNGVRLPFDLLGRPAEDWSTSGFKIHVNADYISGLRMDIPPDFVDVSKYCATLGHKMNHSFKANCVAWFFDHPR